VLLAPLGAGAQLPGFADFERSLRLTPHQKDQFDVAVAATQRAMIAIGLGVLQAKSRLGNELLKDKPDVEQLMMAQQELLEFSKPHVQSARDEWVRLYATLDDDQVRIARAFIDEKLRLLEQVGAQLGRSLAEKLQK
jgi:hypothetical protein